MNIIRRLKKVIEDLKNSKEYRDAFVEEHIDTGVPFQIHALREERKWTQKDLGIHAGMAQETISRLEDPSYGKLTLKTLKRLASAFDVALMVRFVPFSELVEWELHLTPDSLKAQSFEEESYFKEKPDEGLRMLYKVPEQPSPDYSRLILGVKEGSKISGIYEESFSFHSFQRKTQRQAHELIGMRIPELGERQ
jgi:transcriptional regulator with XRE-family HTH domain